MKELNFSKNLPDKGRNLIKRLCLSIFLLVAIVTNAFPAESIQQNEVNGTVTDKNGLPIPGVTIQIKGENDGTMTDMNGDFSITVDDNDVLVFSSIGFETQEVPVSGQSSLSIVLQDKVGELDEVVVVGYGSVRKKDLTGSVASLNTDDFNPGANASVDQLILGRSAGVQVTQTSSEPGGGLSIRVRGASSITGGNEPLYVIDGVPIDNSSFLSGGGVAGVGDNPNPRNPLNAINPKDIASIEILKDASATAIYGSRGANGVVLVTTKRGKKGEINVNYDFYTGIQSANELEVLSTQEYIQVLNGIAVDSGNEPVFTQSGINEIGAGVNWQKQIYRDAPISNHNLSASGGDENTTFYASLNYYDQEGVVKNSGIKKYIGRVNLERDLGEKVKLGLNINTSLVKDNNNVDGVRINEEAGPIYAALLYDPTEPIYNEDGTFHFSENLTVNNPLSLIEGISSNNETNRTFGNIFLEYDIFDDLMAKLNFGSDRQNFRRDIYNSTLTFLGSARNGIADITTIERSNVLLEYTMQYNKQINDDNNLNVLGGVTYQNFVNRRFGANISNFPSDVLGTNNFGLGDTETDNTGSYKSENTLLSYLARANYNFKDKYLLTASIRADGSSRFGENNKYGYFPSFAFAWRLSNEEFVSDFFEDLKLRASWGQTGNQEIGNYASQSTFTAAPPVVFGESLITGTNPSRIANPDLKWETTEQFNVGLNASILDGKINATADYFIKNTKDMLMHVPLPPSTGFGSQLSNVGSMENRGFEFLLETYNISSEDFNWSTTLNFSAIENEVTDLGGESQIITGGLQAIGNTAIIKEGYPVSSYYGYEVTGIFNSEAEVAQSAQPDSQPGYPIFNDINDDGQINAEDLTVLGSPFPDFTFGISNTLNYRNFQLDFFIQGQEGADLLNINLIESLYPSNFRRNRLRETGLNRWTPDNTNTMWPSGVEPSAYGGSKINTLALQDASYIRLKNVQLSYNLPVENIRFLSALKLYVTGQNLVTITDYIGTDPEANAFGRSNVRVDYNGYPLSKTFLFGVNVGF